MFLVGVRQHLQGSSSRQLRKLLKRVGHAMNSRQDALIIALAYCNIRGSPEFVAAGREG
jgi:hypothetical protein